VNNADIELVHVGMAFYLHLPFAFECVDRRHALDNPIVGSVVHMTYAMADLAARAMHFQQLPVA
jgi:hypothetical protein